MNRLAWSILVVLNSAATGIDMGLMIRYVWFGEWLHAFGLFCTTIFAGGVLLFCLAQLIETESRKFKH